MKTDKPQRLRAENRALRAELADLKWRWQRRREELDRMEIHLRAVSGRKMWAGAALNFGKGILQLALAVAITVFVIAWWRGYFTIDAPRCPKAQASTVKSGA